MQVFLCFIFAAKNDIMIEERLIGDGDLIVQRYVDILTDAGFKAVFGDQRNKDVLMDLLNVLLPAERRVEEIEYNTTEIPGFTPETKSVRIDLRCTSSDGTRFIVEMQKSRQKNFFRRCVEYASKVYDSGSRRGDNQRYDIQPVYFIGILGTRGLLKGHTGPEWEDVYFSEYTFREKRTHEVPDETISLIFAELDRFDKSLAQCESLQEKWCYSLKHVGKLHELPDGLKIRTFERLFEACEIARFSPEKKLQYESDMITERDYYNILETAKEDGEAKGLARGREEGFAEGEAKGIGKVAKAMLASGMPVEQISSLTGLSAEEIGNL